MATVDQLSTYFADLVKIKPNILTIVGFLKIEYDRRWPLLKTCAKTHWPLAEKLHGV